MSLGWECRSVIERKRERKEGRKERKVNGREENRGKEKMEINKLVSCLSHHIENTR
jgi:hypothetical protein